MAHDKQKKLNKKGRMDYPLLILFAVIAILIIILTIKIWFSGG